jgi:8-oxo-dGTP pyrophosphatase MutT (NUDIX family)
VRDPRVGPLLAELDALSPLDDAERDDVAATRALLEAVPHPLDEDAQPDHITVSGFVVSSLGVVLHHHKHLAIWVQPGGHVDPDETPHRAVLREVLEETGLRAHHLFPARLVHVNLHDGPWGHRHFDCRWLLWAHAVPLRPGPGESPDVGWFSPDAALERCEPGLRAGLGKALGTARARRVRGVASWTA